jgi:CheY-like chemotaxis protein
MENPQNPNPHDDQPVRILVADADRSEHLLLTMAAEECQQHVHFDFVRTGDELLRSLTNDSFPIPDLLLLDLHLPRVDAHSVLISLGLHERLTHLPVVVLAPQPSASDARACYAFGAFHVKVKPRTFGDMVGLIDRLTDLERTDGLRPLDLGSIDVTRENANIAQLEG